MNLNKGITPLVKKLAYNTIYKICLWQWPIGKNHFKGSALTMHHAIFSFNGSSFGGMIGTPVHGCYLIVLQSTLLAIHHMVSSNIHPGNWRPRQPPGIGAAMIIIPAEIKVGGFPNLN